MRNFFVVTLLIVIGSCQSGFTGKIRKTNRNLLGQTAPNDMIFIEGNDSMPSFYIGVCEEPNINYIIYLKWLKAVYGADYPNVVLEALPHKDNGEEVTGLHDPYITGYLTNPIFAFHPVVNLDFEQIQKYLAWKTDRLNEAILIKNKYLKVNPNQVSEDNFVTEAYLNGQYAGLKWDFDFNCSAPPDRGLLNDGSFFTGFRLPTEAEWKLVNQPKYKNTKQAKKANVFSKNRGFGQGYFLNVFAEQLFSYRSTNYTSPDFHLMPSGLKTYELDPSDYASANYKSSDSGYVSMMNYKSNSYGVINMEGGVKELLLDVYSDSLSYQKSWLEIMKTGRFETENVVLFDADCAANKCELQKDSLGHMNYRFVGVDKNGLPIPIKRKLSGEPLNRVVIGGTFDNPGTFRSFQNDTSASNQVGFRCVLPYIGAPVKKGQKVSW